MSEEQPQEQLETVLDGIVAPGIQADVQALKRSICQQFPDPRQWVREFAANSADAAAPTVRFSGRETENTITIIVADDGCGMDRAGVINFMTLFRSPERWADCPRIGRHGIGKLSVAAMPGQCGFLMLTSTGTECWRLRTGCLLDDAPIRVERVARVPRRGTRFEVTFARQVALAEELRLIRSLLHTYCRYLRARVAVCMLDERAEGVRRRWEVVNEPWEPRGHTFSRGTQHLHLAGYEFAVVLSLEPGGHELFQNRVLVTNGYNLLSYDLSTPLSIPHIHLRVDSEVFELPFGRHRLSNEEVLRPLTAHLRTKVLPAFVATLCSLYERERLEDYGVLPQVVEEIACAMMSHAPEASHAWSNLRVFSLCNGFRTSLAALLSAARRHGRIFLEDHQSPGIDYSVFDVPVLSARQPAGGLEVLRKLLGAALVDLTVEDVVVEAPAGSVPELQAREKLFQRFLRFSPEAVRRARRKNDEGGGRRRAGTRFDLPTPEQLARLAGLSEEALMARADLEQLRWRVSYLVARDGVTPCRSHRFLIHGNVVVVNLYHPDVVRLLQLSEQAPTLSGHWGLAMCLTDTRKILPHLTPAAREDLILADAMAKCGATFAEEEEPVVAGGFDPSDWDFRRDLRDDGFGID